MTSFNEIKTFDTFGPFSGTLQNNSRSIILKPSPLSEDKNRILKIQQLEELQFQFDSIKNIPECGGIYVNVKPILYKLNEKFVDELNILNGADVRDDDTYADDDILRLGENEVYALEYDYIPGETLSDILNNTDQFKFYLMKLVEFVRTSYNIFNETGFCTCDLDVRNIICSNGEFVHIDILDEPRLEREFFTIIFANIIYGYKEENDFGIPPRDENDMKYINIIQSNLVRFDNKEIEIEMFFSEVLRELGEN